MKRRNLLLVLGIMMVSVQVTATSALAQRSWTLMGSARFGTHQMNHGVITVTARRTFTAIRFKADHAPARITRGLVRYQNGYIQRIPVRVRLRQNGRTRAYALRGGRRYVRKIEFWGYSTSRKNIDSKILVYGR